MMGLACNPLRAGAVTTLTLALWRFGTMKIYGLSRSRDKKGAVVKQEPQDWVNCIHAQVGGGWETMLILVLEVYEDGDTDKGA